MVNRAIAFSGSPGRAATRPGSSASAPRPAGRRSPRPRSAAVAWSSRSPSSAESGLPSFSASSGSRSLKIEPRISLAFSIWVSRFSACALSRRRASACRAFSFSWPRRRRSAPAAAPRPAPASSRRSRRPAPAAPATPRPPAAGSAARTSATGKPAVGGPALTGSWFVNRSTSCASAIADSYRRCRSLASAFITIQSRSPRTNRPSRAGSI